MPSQSANSSNNSTNVKVAVRIRPIDSSHSKHTQQLLLDTAAAGTEQPVRVAFVSETDRRQIILQPLAPQQQQQQHQGRRSEFIGIEGRVAQWQQPKLFTFDHLYDSAVDRHHSSYASQQCLYEDLGAELLEHAFRGYNSTIMAYGQTGSGKSYTMTGDLSVPEERGLIPRICEALFARIRSLLIDDNKASPLSSFHVEASYMEIYNETCRDLLVTTATTIANSGLRIREHPTVGPYVEGLSRVTVSSSAEINELFARGNMQRTTAATNMNDNSSRSHAVFTIILKQRRKLADTSGAMFEAQSRIHLVDLAGSERANSTGATGERLREGANINLSLTTLGKVISALAESGSSTNSNSSAIRHIPYRDSVLTWLLKDSLGGNSKTTIIATVSPSSIYYEETLSTLRYADRAKRIVNRAVINEDPNKKIIRELRAEVAALRLRISELTAGDIEDPNHRALTSLSLETVDTNDNNALVGSIISQSQQHLAALKDQLRSAESLIFAYDSQTAEDVASEDGGDFSFGEKSPDQSGRQSAGSKSSNSQQEFISAVAETGINESEQPTAENKLVISRQQIINHWRQYRSNSLKSDIVRHSDDLRLANAIFAELRLPLEFEFRIVDKHYPPTLTVGSFWQPYGPDYWQRKLVKRLLLSEDSNDPVSTLQSEEFYFTILRSADRPQLAVCLRDNQNSFPAGAGNVIWPMVKFKQVLDRLQELDTEDLASVILADADEPVKTGDGFRLLGVAKQTVRLLQPGDGETKCRIPIIDYDGEEIGVRGYLNATAQIVPGVLQISVVSVECPSLVGRGGDARLHIQWRLSSTANGATAVPLGSAKDLIFASEPVQLTSHSQIIDFTRQIIVDTAAPLDYLPLEFEVYYQPPPPPLSDGSKLLRELQDKSPEVLHLSPSTSGAERYRHDVLSWVEICELGPESGRYSPVPVLHSPPQQQQRLDDPGAFILQQGVQRRLVLTMMHDSGRKLPLSGISAVAVGQCRECLFNSKTGEYHSFSPVDPQSFDLQLQPSPNQRLSSTSSGKSILWAECAWDSSLHESVLLNQVTADDDLRKQERRVALTIQWQVELQKSTDNGGDGHHLSFETVIYLRIVGRDMQRRAAVDPNRRRSSLKWLTGLLGGSSAHNSRLIDIRKFSFVSDVFYGPPALMGNNRRRQSIQQDFRNIALVDRYYFARQRIEYLNDVERVRCRLAVANDLEFLNFRRSSIPLDKLISLWRYDPLRIRLQPDPMNAAGRWISDVEVVPRSAVVAFSGHLEFPSQPGQNDRWQRKWFAIRRPYMYIYEDCTESDEIGVISLLDIKIQYDLSVLEQATARANLFCVFTKHHGYVFQAESAGSKMQWLSQIDPLRISADQSNSVMS